MASLGKSFFILCLLISICSGYAKRSKRIVNGLEAARIPYVVSILTTARTVLCSGSILDSTHILTVAHCLVDEYKNPHLYVSDVVVGSITVDNVNLNNRYRIINKTIHNDLSPFDSWKNDIAVLKLDREIKFDQFRQPIKLAAEEVDIGTRVYFSGWGATQWISTYQEGDAYPRFLRFGFGKVISNSICQREMRFKTIHPQHICVYSNGDGSFCMGDGGAPLVNGTHIIGIATFNRHCSRYYPDVFTRIYHYVDWIKNAMKN